MILLEKSDYYKVREPLKSVKSNHLFARTIVEQHLDGKIYVDNVETPGTFYIIHPYGMSLLFGKSDNEGFNSNFLDFAFNTNKIRNRAEWMQAYPNDWNTKLSDLFGNKMIKSTDNSNMEVDCKVELHTRVNFRFDLKKYQDFKQNIDKGNFNIVRTGKEIFKDMQGSVVPMYFWKDEEDFSSRGMGFSLFHEHKLASTAYSAFIHDNLLEIGIETVEQFRNKGFAQYSCSALIDYCLENNLEPIWSCRLENTGSYKLAQKIGFEPTIYLPFYKLMN